MRLLWDPFHPEHGKNVVTLFTVQVRPIDQSVGREARPTGGRLFVSESVPPPPREGLEGGLPKYTVAHAFHFRETQLRSVRVESIVLPPHNWHFHTGPASAAKSHTVPP